MRWIPFIALENRKLSYSWHNAEDPETIVTWTPEGPEGGTRLTLVNSGFAPDSSADDYTTGWFKFVNDLKSMIEIGPTWQKAVRATLTAKSGARRSAP